MEVPKVAVALGASIIEKHFTIDNSLPGADHSMSANPEVFKTMVKQCNNINEMIGTRRLNEPYKCEKNSIQFCVSD